MKKQTKNFINSCRYKVLTASIAAISTLLITSSVVQASDIDIYQDAKSGDITLMFMLDVSTSMNEKMVKHKLVGNVFRLLCVTC
ncbi:hypothetical protein [Acinetobacter gandensis]|uniref:hypothetical protein n=1 Tax=Acinetobacter gandensis TaxID=1443941 RepID=UPI00398A2C1E